MTRDDPGSGARRRDPAVDAALEEVVRLLGERHDLDPHQLLSLAAELQRHGVERLVEERIGPLRSRGGAGRVPPSSADPEGG